MSLKPLLSFASGELDPILTDNVTLEKFNKGLATGRNAVIGKTGSIKSRFARRQFATAKTSGVPIKIYHPPNTDYLLEFGPGYLRLHWILGIESFDFFQDDLSGFTGAVDFTGLDIAQNDLPNLNFTTNKDYVYIFCLGKKIMKLFLNYLSSSLLSDGNKFLVPNPLTSVTVTPVGTPTGYTVDYLATIVINGEESLSKEITSGYNKPIADGQRNNVFATWVTSAVDANTINEVRFYSRPTGGGAYGLLGTSSKFSISGSNTIASFQDIGSLPDYGNGVQDIITKFGLGGEQIIDLIPRTGIIYQQRLLQTCKDDEEAIFASRPGFQNNFYRDFPYASDSALQFKVGTSGRAKVYRFVESDGLVVFTSNGVYTNSGLLSVNNIVLERKGSWIINPYLPPLVAPGGVFFVDNSNVIRQLIFSQDILAYESIEQTIFSNHLFKDKPIKSWSFQNGNVPVIIVIFFDGTFATFTYNFEQQMRAWMRHDSKYDVEQVESIVIKPDVSFFVTDKANNRSIEFSVPRIISADTKFDNPEAEMLHAFMDSYVIVGNSRPFEELEGSTDYTMSPTTPNVWDGELVLDYPDQEFDPGEGPFIPGETYRFFHPVDKSVVDLLCLSSSTLQTYFFPSDEFPSDYADSPRIYKTYNVITGGMSHLEGESVSVMVDGSLVTSPYNDVEGYPEITVTSNSITLPSGMRGAIIVVGRPIVADVKTLNVSTVEQSPTLIESLNCNKLYIRVNESRGMYCSNKFPEELLGQKDGTSVANMENLDEALVPLDDILIGNRYFPPISKRIEKSVPGSWDSQGQISIRQVDPYHFEILSIIPDLEVLTRSNR